MASHVHYQRKTKQEVNSETTQLKCKRKWSVIYALEEVFAVIDKYGFERCDILVSCDLDGVCRRSRKKQAQDRETDLKLAEEDINQFLAELAKMGIGFFNNAASLVRPDSASSCHESTNPLLVLPELLLDCQRGALSDLVLSPVCSPKIDEESAPDKKLDSEISNNIKLVLHVDDSLVNIYNVLSVQCQHSEVCIHALFFPPTSQLTQVKILEDKPDCHTQKAALNKFLRCTEVST